MRPGHTSDPATRDTDEIVIPGPPLSVAYVCPFWPPDRHANGIVMYLNEITTGLRATGHTTTLLTQQVSPGGMADGIYDLAEVRVRRTLPGRILDQLGSRTDPCSVIGARVCRSIVAAARRSIDERGTQILEMEESFGWAERVRRALTIPVVVRLHGPWFLNGAMGNATDDPAYRRRVRLEGEAIRNADGVSASSRDVLERTRAFYNLPLEDAEVIHPPSPVVPEDARWDPGRCEPQSVLFIGRFDRHKGGDIAIEAFALAARRFPEARFRFVGPDPGVVDDQERSWNLLEFLRDRVPDEDVRDRIEWLGQLPNSAVMDLRRRSLVSVVASRYDNFPTTVTEAIAMGCPIVAPATGGILEQIKHDVSGLLCRPNDPVDLAGQIGRLLADPVLAERLGRRARLDCEAMLSPWAITRDMAAFYCRVRERANAVGTRRR